MVESVTGSQSRSTRILFQTGWWGQLVLLTLVALASHLAGIWYIASSRDEAQMFFLFFAQNVLYAVLLLVPYRRLERWAWWVVWLAILPFASLPAFGLDGITLMYLGFAAFFAVCQFLTLPRFRQEPSTPH